MDTDRLKAYLDERFDSWVRDEETGLTGFLRIPSISGDPDHVADVRRSAEWLAEAFRRSGFPTVELWETPGNPSVFAEWPADDPDAPVVVVYGHHDVQPVDPLELWDTPPFEPTIRGEELFARGAIDDKGQVLFHLLGVDAWFAANEGRTAPPVTLKFVVEGEEENGSKNFAALLRANRERLRCDAVIVSDTALFERDTPTINTGMRGLLGATVVMHGPDVDLHSGSFGGGVPNPLTVMARMLGRLHDDQGRVALPGFYDAVVPLTERERQLFAKLPFDESRFLETAQSRAPGGEEGYSTLERVWARPTAEINGMWGGYMGPGGKTIVPTDAHAKVSFRIVADQRPEDVSRQFEQFVADHTPPGITVSVTWEGHGVRPCLTPLDHPALQAATRAMERVFAGDVLYTRDGGSGPEADLADILEAPVVFVGVGLPDDRIHAPNERAVLPMLRLGAEVAACLWDEYARALRPSADRR